MVNFVGRLTLRLRPALCRPPARHRSAFQHIAAADVERTFLIASGYVALPGTLADLVRMMSTERSLRALHFALSSLKLRGVRSRTAPEILRPA